MGMGLETGPTRPRAREDLAKRQTKRGASLCPSLAGALVFEVPRREL